jgi:penicillin-binding protein 1A
VYIGFDTPRDMGGYAQGGSLAAPIFKQFALAALADRQPVPFVAPRGVRMVRIDRRSGKRIYGGWPGDDPKAAIIWEAFKPESEPRRTIRQDEVERRSPTTRRGSATKSGPAQRSDQDFLEDRGGII